MEVELKLSLPHCAIAALRRHPLIAACPKIGNEVTLENVYYDTPTLAFKAAYIGLRTRRQGQRWLQTVKAASISTAGLSSRPEWEQTYCGTFDFSNVDDDGVRKLLQRHIDVLVPVFSTRFRRETRSYAPTPGVEIHLMLDIGEISAGEHAESLCELELELVRGEALDLLQFATRLSEDLPLLPDDRSKAERGYRLYLNSPSKPMHAPASPVSTSMSPLNAFRELSFAYMRQWQANVTGALDSNTPEFIHPLHTSLLQLHSLIGLFTNALPPEFFTCWSTRLATNARHVGETRDLDVLNEKVLVPVVATDPALHISLKSLRNKLAAARGEANKTFNAAEQGRLLLSLAEALFKLPDDEAFHTSLTAFAALQLEALRTQAHHHHRTALDRTPQHLRALHIAIKQLRHGIGFFTPLLPISATDRYVEELVRIQSALDFVRDFNEAHLRLIGWVEDDPTLAPAVAYVTRWHAPRYTRMMERALSTATPLLTGDATPWAVLHEQHIVGRFE